MLFSAIAAKSSIDNSRAIHERRQRAGRIITVVGGIGAQLFVLLLAYMLAGRGAEPSVDTITAVVERVLRGLGRGAGLVDVRTQLLIVGVVGAMLVVYAAVMTAHGKNVLTVIRRTLPQAPPEMAAAPADALPEPRGYVKRPELQEAIDSLVDPDNGRTPYTITTQCRIQGYTYHKVKSQQWLYLPAPKCRWCCRYRRREIPGEGRAQADGCLFCVLKVCPLLTDYNVSLRGEPVTVHPPKCLSLIEGVTCEDTARSMTLVAQSLQRLRLLEMMDSTYPQ